MAAADDILSAHLPLVPPVQPHPFTQPIHSNPPILSINQPNQSLNQSINGLTPCVIDVYASNLITEFQRLISLIDDYPIIGFDSCFPGILFRPVSINQTNSQSGNQSINQYRYATLKANVDVLNPLSFAISIVDQTGSPIPVNHPSIGHLSTPIYCHSTDQSLTQSLNPSHKQFTHYLTWNFHFRFSINTDFYAEDSLSYLINNRAVNLNRLEQDGIDHSTFAELLMTSGLILNRNVTWTCRDAAYDFALLMKLCTALPLPETYQNFAELMSLYFPNVFDSQVIEATKESNDHGGTTVDHSIKALQRFFRAQQQAALTQDALMSKNRILHGLAD